MNNAKVLREVEAYRLKVLEVEPFWSVTGFRLTPVVCTEFEGRPVKTAATDGNYLFVNPDYWQSVSMEEKLTIVLHEIGHVALGHTFRRQGRDHKYFNIACDHALNNILKGQGHPVPDNWYCEKEYDEMAEERIYSKIYPGPGPDGPVGPPGEEKGGDGPPKGGTPTEPGEEEVPGEVWDSTNEDGSELSDEERHEKMRELASDLQQAKHVQKSCGKSTKANLRRSIDKLLNPRMNWRNYLNRYFKERGRPVGRTWSKLDRRAMVNGIYQPGEIREGMEWLLLGFDISGSVGIEEQRAFLSHIESIRKTVKIDRVTVLPFNHGVVQSGIVDVNHREKLPKSFGYGGGTAYAPIFNWVRRQNKTPDSIIVFTDLYCSDYGEPVPTSILWASSEEVHKDKESWRYNMPPFGNAIEITTD